MDTIDRELLNAAQADMPLTERPFADLGARLGLSEDEVLGRLEVLRKTGVLQRIGPVIAPHRLGVSTLAAIAVPESEVEAMAERLNGFPEINHNYERTHHYNLWFVITAPDQQRLKAILDTIASWVTEPVLHLPMERAYHIDLGFPL